MRPSVRATSLPLHSFVWEVGDRDIRRWPSLCVPELCCLASPADAFAPLQMFGGRCSLCCPFSPQIREENPRLARDSKILKVTMDNVYEVRQSCGWRARDTAARGRQGRWHIGRRGRSWEGTCIGRMSRGVVLGAGGFSRACLPIHRGPPARVPSFRCSQRRGTSQGCRWASGRGCRRR